MNIQDFRQKINSLVADDAVFMALLIVLVGLASFGLGRQSVGLNVAQNSPNVQAAAAVAADPVNSISDSGEVESVTYVGSKNSNKYHLPFCSGAKRISEENLVTFTSKEEARAAGYTPAANCPGI